MGKKNKAVAKTAAESKADDTAKPSNGLPFLASTAAVDPSLASLFEKSVRIRCKHVGPIDVLICS